MSVYIMNRHRTATNRRLFNMAFCTKKIMTVVRMNRALFRGRYSIVRISVKPVTSKISMIVSLT